MHHGINLPIHLPELCNPRRRAEICGVNPAKLQRPRRGAVARCSSGSQERPGWRVLASAIPAQLCVAFTPNRPLGTANSIWNRYFSSNGGGQPTGPSAADAQLDKAFDEIRSMWKPMARRSGAGLTIVRR